MKTKTTILIYFLILQLSVIKAQVETQNHSFFGKTLSQDEMIQTIAPNSYILDINSNYNGFYIPVKKAFVLWNTILKTDADTTLGNKYSVAMYWEDVPGLIDAVSLEGNGSNAKIKVLVNKAKGKGNAVISFHAGNFADPKKDPILWSWHVWVTDDPTNGVEFSQEYNQDRNLKGDAFIPKYMDRNLGASSNNFLGNDWAKSGGLMFQWGRKDPIPPLLYKDFSFYNVSGLVGKIKHLYSFGENATTLPISQRPSENPIENIKFSVQNPLNVIVSKNSDPNTELKKTWIGTLGNTEFDNLWGAIKVDTNTAAPTYLFKSPFDPCPNGWRVPAHRSKYSNAAYSPWGKSNNEKCDPNTNITCANAEESIVLNPETKYADKSGFNGVKIYPSLGYDFSNVKNRSIGTFPLTGKMHFEVNRNNASETPRIFTQDVFSEVNIWSATNIGNESRNMFLINDVHRVDINEKFGLQRVMTSSSNYTYAGNAVRCIADPNFEYYNSNFETEFINESNTVFKTGIDNPNSYVVMNNKEEDQVLNIPVSKGYAMYNQYFSKNEMPSGAQTPSIFWTTNKNLIKSIKLIEKGQDELNEIEITFNNKQHGNALVALHLGSQGTQSPILWSWHIWAPIADPNDPMNQISYVTESVMEAENMVNATRSGFPPLKTTFMDKDLGALEALPSDPNKKDQIKNAGGMHYQWGRKDPMPSFHNPGGSEYQIYKQTDINPDGTIVYGDVINDEKFMNTGSNGYSKEYKQYSKIAGINTQDKIQDKVRKIILYSTQNPLTFMFHQNAGVPFVNVTAGGKLSENLNYIKDWVSDERGVADNRWGHGTKKSPFDPCPQGWRVPDTSFTLLFNNTNGMKMDGAKGSSPWYYSNVEKAVKIANTNTAYYGLMQNRLYDLTGNDNQNLITEEKYPGKTLSVVYPSTRTGWVFENEKYKIGNFPATGIRGILGGNGWVDPSVTGYNNGVAHNISNFRYRTGVWTAAMAELSTGYAIAMDLYSINGFGGKFTAGAGHYPQAAMSVRCAKDEARYEGFSINNNDDDQNSDEGNDGKSIVPLPEIIDEKVSISIYPNPIQNELNINSNNVFKMEILDTTGNIVLNDDYLYKTKNISSLKKGLYIVKLTEWKTNKVITSKIIKN